MMKFRYTSGRREERGGEAAPGESLEEHPGFPL